MRSGPRPANEAQLAQLCARLGADRIAGLSAAERALLAAGAPVDPALIATTLASIRAGGDPLGEWFCALRTPRERRGRGATYTPLPIVEAMVRWGAAASAPGRVVDPGTGSGRFLLAAARAMPEASLIGVELDPLAALLARANLAVAGCADRAEVHLADYRALALPPHSQPTLFAGNPPYVRHHHIDRRWKTWLRDRAAALGLRSSQLAGLHVHFFLATAGHARPGDTGILITAGEWLDVNYGALVRELLAGPLGLERLEILDPRAAAFDDAQTTAVVTGFRIGSQARSVRVRRVRTLRGTRAFAGGIGVARTALAASRWSELGRRRRTDPDLVELGELCRVHRGQVTGANAIWIHGAGAPPLPEAYLRPTITRARELFASAPILGCTRALRRVVDLPLELEALDRADRPRVDAFLRWARARGADASYIARHRSPWWSVKLRRPAPILATYMARRAPAFVRNPAGAHHLNIAHGIYPRDALLEPCLDVLAEYLSGNVSVRAGRTYAGGLTKFEPGEMARLPVPRPEILEQLAAEARG